VMGFLSVQSKNMYEIDMFTDRCFSDGFSICSIKVYIGSKHS